MKLSLVFATLLGVLASCSSYSPPDPCPGAQDCGDGTCAPLGNVCCGNGTSCPHNTVCAPGNTCVDSRVAAFLESGEEACNNSDGTIDCAPLGAACCGNHRFCPSGTVCVNGGASCAP